MGCESIARGLLLIFNLLFLLIGAAALGVGIWVLIDASIFLDIFSKIPDSVTNSNTATYGNLIKDAAYIFVAAGGLVFLLAFLGCCGAWKKVKILLMIYAILISLLVLLEVGCVVVAVYFSSYVTDLINKDLAAFLSSSYNSTFTVKASDPNTYDYSSLSPLSKGIDALQIQFKCCGVKNVTDYKSIDASLSCCSVPSAGLEKIANDIWSADGPSITFSDAACPADSMNATLGNRDKGCYDEIKNYITERSTIFIGIGAGVLGLEVFVILLSCCLFCAIRNEEKRD